jgi:parallel beta-helix repeat protein
MNRTTFHALLVLALGLLAGLPRLAHAAQSYDNCTGFITSIPTTITTQGTWCLKQDLATAITSGMAINISADNVTIDCNDFKIGGLAAGAGTQAEGIYAAAVQNVTVRNCNIRGFATGIYLGHYGGFVVEDNRLDSNTEYGMYVYGDGSVVRRNRVFDTGGSSVVSSASPYGIATVYSVDVLDNTVSGVAATVGNNGYAHGISAQINDGGSISGNRVRAVLADGTGQASGIAFSGGSSRNTIRGNDVIGSSAPGINYGVQCGNANQHAKDNVINGFATGILTCTDDGNVVAP